VPLARGGASGGENARRYVRLAAQLDPPAGSAPSSPARRIRHPARLRLSTDGVRRPLAPHGCRHAASAVAAVVTLPERWLRIRGFRWLFVDAENDRTSNFRGDTVVVDAHG